MGVASVDKVVVVAESVAIFVPFAPHTTVDP